MARVSLGRGEVKGQVRKDFDLRLSEAWALGGGIPAPGPQSLRHCCASGGEGGVAQGPGCQSPRESVPTHVLWRGAQGLGTLAGSSLRLWL